MPSSPEQTRGFRPDIQGLRAVAVGLVLLYHAGVPPFEGGYVGVDVFFVISGYLISRHLIEQIERTGRVNFGEFYARRARRILPASLAVVVFTSVALIVTAPPLSLAEMLGDAVATVLYVPNIRFAIEETDYLADHQASPFQHYWSLGVEEQFYLLWPLLLLLIVVVARRRRGVVGVFVTAAAVVSFVMCVMLTQTAQPMAFFLLHARSWELLAGALVALMALSRRPTAPSWVSAAGGWLGLAAVLAAGILYDDGTPFPGAAAALPVVGTAMVIHFGASGAAGGPTTVLALRGLQFVGLISYSLYLVHWPLLIVPELALGDGGNLPSGWRVLTGIVLAVPIAWLLYRFVEEPARALPRLVRRPPGITLLTTAAVTVVMAGSLMAATIWAADRPIAGSADTAAAPTQPVAPPTEAHTAPANLTPSLRDAAADVPDVYEDDCHHDTQRTSVQDCVYGDPAAGLEIALFGDSHAAQWLPALQTIAETDPMAIRAFTKSSCPAVDVTILVKNAPYTSCDQWRSAVIQHLESDPPDLVVLSSYALHPLRGDATGQKRRDEWSAGLGRTVAALRAAGSRVLVIADTPHFDAPPPACVSMNVSDVTACAGDPSTALDALQTSAERDATVAAGGDFIDLTPYICSADACPVVVFDLLVYRDVNHLTTPFVRYLAPPIADAIDGTG